MVEATRLGLENESDLSPEREERRALGPWGMWRNPEPEKSLSCLRNNVSWAASPGRSPGKHSCQVRDIELREVWRRPELGLDLKGKEGLGRKMSRNFVLQVLLGC